MLSAVKLYDCFLRQVRPAYLATAAWLLNLVISPNSAIIPAAKTGPMPGIESKHWNWWLSIRLIAFSIALSNPLTSFSNALIQLREAAIVALSGS